MYIKSTVNKNHRQPPYKILVDRSIKLLNTPPKPLHQYNFHIIYDDMLNYCDVLIKCLRTMHSQVKEAFPEPACGLCGSWEPADWVCIKLHQPGGKKKAKKKKGRKKAVQPR